MSADKKNKEGAHTKAQDELDKAQRQSEAAKAVYETSNQKSSDAAQALANKQTEIDKLNKQKEAVDSLLADQNNENAFTEANSDSSKIPKTMNDLRELVFNAITINSMIFGSGDQYEFDHARGILGVTIRSRCTMA